MGAGRKRFDLLHDQARTWYKFQFLQCLAEVLVVKDLPGKVLSEALHVPPNLITNSLRNLEQRRINGEGFHDITTRRLKP